LEDFSLHRASLSNCAHLARKVRPSGKIAGEYSLPARVNCLNVSQLDVWMKYLPQPWIVAMEATIFTGWVYDHLLPYAAQVKVAHPVMLQAITAAKKKNDRVDARKIADCLRCDFLPECHMVSTAIRDRRRTLRYRHLLVRQMVQMKNRVSGLLLETGVPHKSSDCTR
jgi:transposase